MQSSVVEGLDYIGYAWINRRVCPAISFRFCQFNLGCLNAPIAHFVLLPRLTRRCCQTSLPLGSKAQALSRNECRSRRIN